MLLQIYKSMVDYVQAHSLPEYVHSVFYIDKEHSDLFWNDSDYATERGILLNEWEASGAGRYEKTFYGLKFAIQFNWIG